MHYYKAREAEYIDVLRARNYLCKGMQLVVEHTAHFVGSGESTPILVEWEKFTKKEKRDERTADEIAEDIIQRAGIMVVTDDESIRGGSETHA